MSNHTIACWSFPSPAQALANGFLPKKHSELNNQCSIIVLSSASTVPISAAVGKLATVESTVMPTPRKPITSMRILCKTSFWRLMSMRGRQF